MDPTSHLLPPPLFVAVDTGCNLRCWYCTEFGENRAADPALGTDDLLALLAQAYVLGVRTFRFTGGEPTLRSDLGDLLLGAQALGDDVRVAITTNGARLEPLGGILAELIRPRVFLSVDGIDRALERAQRRSGKFRIHKWLTPRLQRMVRTLRGHAHVRLNYVLTQDSAPQLEPLLAWAASEGVDVKIFELLLRDFFYSGHRPRLAVFREQYVAVGEVLPTLRRRYGDPRPFAGTGGRGIPMRAFDTGASRIVYFDSSEGSHYGAACTACAAFPCQEGLYALVLDAGGVLHPAGCENAALREPLAGRAPADVRAGMTRIQAVIDDAELLAVVPQYLRSVEAVA